MTASRFLPRLRGQVKNLKARGRMMEDTCQLRSCEIDKLPTNEKHMKGGVLSGLDKREKRRRTERFGKSLDLAGKPQPQGITATVTTHTHTHTHTFLTSGEETRGDKYS